MAAANVSDRPPSAAAADAPPTERRDHAMSMRDSGRSNRPTLGHLILVLATVIALTALPISIEPESLAVTWQAAHGDHRAG